MILKTEHDGMTFEATATYTGGVFDVETCCIVSESDKDYFLDPRTLPGDLVDALREEVNNEQSQ